MSFSVLNSELVIFNSTFDLIDGSMINPSIVLLILDCPNKQSVDNKGINMNRYFVMLSLSKVAYNGHGYVQYRI